LSWHGARDFLIRNTGETPVPRKLLKPDAAPALIAQRRLEVTAAFFRGSQLILKRALLLILFTGGSGLFVGCVSRGVAPESSQNYVAPQAGMALGDLVPAQSLPARDEELWIIEKQPANAAASDSSPNLSAGSGMLLSIHGATLTPLPLEKTDVQASIDGIIASVDVQQRFMNSSREVADAVYAFPLPQNAAVNEFIMSIGRRHIRAILREKTEAEKIFREAKSQGLLTSLMVQQSPNIFAQRVANLEPGAAVDVEIRYFHTVEFRDGSFEFEFPMIAGLRGQEVKRAVQRNGRNISLAVHLNAGMAIEGVESQSHKIAVRMGDSGVADASLENADTIPNRDFVLRYKLAGEQVKASLVTEKDGDGGVFGLLMIPPATTANLPRRSLQAIFAISADAGAEGNKVVATLLAGLTSDDTFQAVRGDGDNMNLLPARATAAKPEAVSKYGNLFSTMKALEPVNDTSFAWAVSLPNDGVRTPIVFLVTSGHLHLDKAIPVARQSARVVVVGVGASPDRVAIESLARATRGIAVYLPPDGVAGPSVTELIDRLSHPALAEMDVDWYATQVSDLYGGTKDLFVGRPVLMTGRYHGTAPAAFAIIGKEAKSWKVKAARLTDIPGRSPLAAIWARRKIADLTLADVTKPDLNLDKEVRDVALEYGLLCRYTAFITVDASRPPAREANNTPVR
jgi:Ca-activated chloride channel family protein